MRGSFATLRMTTCRRAMCFRKAVLAWLGGFALRRCGVLPEAELVGGLEGVVKGVLVGGREDDVRVAHASEASADRQKDAGCVRDETSLHLRREDEIAVALGDAGESGEAAPADGEGRLTAVLVLRDLGK
jgi:hypothetical protein